MPNYSLGKIYKIVNGENDKIYIGSTVQSLANRMNTHRQSARIRPSTFYKAMREVGIDKFNIELIKEYPCCSKLKMEKEEFRIIQKKIAKGITLYNMITEHGITPTCVSIVLSKAQRKRGNVRFEAEVNRWVFQYYPVIGENQKKKSWSVKKYGDAGAKAMAIALRNEIYPKI